MLFVFLLAGITIQAQSVIVDGTLKNSGSGTINYKNYTVELRSDDTLLIEKQRVNTAGQFSFRLQFAHDYYVYVRKDGEVFWKLLIHNKMQYGQIHYPVEVDVSPVPKSKDVYEVIVKSDGTKEYLKNKMPITEITYQFETGRRDSSEIIRK